MIRQVLRGFLFFSKKPNDEKLNYNTKQKIKFLLILLLVELIFTLLVVFPLDFVTNNLTTVKSDKFDYRDTFIELLILGVFVVPFFEELFFRYILRYQGLKTKFINRKTWDKIFPFLVYLSSIGFGFIHLSNYINEDKLFLLLSPLIILSQLVGGLIIVFIRVRINFIWGLFYHWIWNLLFVIIFPIIESELTKPYQENTTTYNITISEKPFFNKKGEHILKIDSTNNSLKKIEIKQYSLQQLLDTLYQKDKYYVDDVLIDLKYDSKNGISKKEFLNIIKKEYDVE